MKNDQEIKCIFVGSHESVGLLRASSFLHSENFPPWVARVYLNYGGDRTSLLHGGQYVSLAEAQSLGRDGWSRYLSTFLESIDDDLILLTLDDFLFGLSLDESSLSEAIQRMRAHPNLLGIKCGLTPLITRSSDVRPDESGWYRLKFNSPYRLTTQLTLWNRKSLLQFLKWTSSAWNFELKGSKLASLVGAASAGRRAVVLCPESPISKYSEYSALSSRWEERVNVFGLQIPMVVTILSMNLLQAQDLIYGHWSDAPPFEDVLKRPTAVLDSCPKMLRKEVAEYLDLLEVGLCVS